jgi:competence protein ComEC
MVPAQKVAALAGAVIAFLYVALAGFGVPAQRTLYMLCVVALAVWNGRVTSFSSVLCLALGLVVVLDPWAVLSPGSGFLSVLSALFYLLQLAMKTVVLSPGDSSLHRPCVWRREHSMP